jgi:hypothetical protein
MYKTTCSNCNGPLFLSEVHATFSPGTVPVDGVIGTCFGMDDIYDCVLETAACGDCGAEYALNDLYQELEGEVIWITEPGAWAH